MPTILGAEEQPQLPNLVFAGPASGSIAANPTFRALVGADFSGLNQIDFAPIATPASPTDGQIWYDQTSKALFIEVNGAPQNLSSILWGQNVVATPYANATAATSLFTGAAGRGSLTIPANFFVVGKMLRVNCYGIISDTGTPTIALNWKLGTTSLVSTTSAALGTGITNVEWTAAFLLTCLATGPTATIIGGGTANIGGTLVGFPMTAAANVNTANAQLLDLVGTWSAASASNTITLQQSFIEVLD